MAILDLQDMEMTQEVATGSSKSQKSCGGGGSRLSLLLC